MMMKFFLPYLETHSYMNQQWQIFYPQGKLTDLNQYVIETFAKNN